ncbi:phage tail protein [Nitrosospira sp. Is2]|uniref:phage tail protein n=1 Tax=Nitrosospira sp. Is2 TaxID=3080532 RepID=UPI002952D1C1|nr:phage tail protein [Nitrosospira sp. Is2]WON73520.1 phage tail protein [Nitrosospira sp. Is2]
MGKPGERLLDSLPAIYRASDASGDLHRLLGVFEEILFSSNMPPPGIEQQIQDIPSLFSPGAGEPGQNNAARTPDRFLPWLATWVAFTPHALFEPQQLRKIISGITPLYGRRGTRAYLEELLRLCFNEISAVEIHDEPEQRFIIGFAKIGSDTLFGDDRPFWFRVTVNVNSRGGDAKITGSRREFEQRVRAIVDFAKPGHTAYELHLLFSSLEESRSTA